MEKQIVFTQLSAKFTKDFDTFGKMDPFLVFKTTNQEEKTPIASDGGKQPKWTATITLRINDITEIEVTAFDEDVASNQFMGVAKIDIKTLTQSGTLKLTFLGQDKTSIGDANLTYEVKQVKLETSKSIQNVSKQVPKNASKNIQSTNNISDKVYPNNILITQISAKFTKNFDTFGKMEPYLTFSMRQERDKTQVTDWDQGQTKWKKTISLGFEDGTDLKVKAYDQDITQNQYMGMTVMKLQKLKNNTTFTSELTDEEGQSIGTVTIKYELKLKSQVVPQKKKTETAQQTSKPAEKPVEKTIEKPAQKLVQQKPVEQKPVQQKPKVQQKKVIQQKKPVQIKQPVRETVERTQKNPTQGSQRKHTQKSYVNQNKIASLPQGNSGSNRPSQNHDTTINHNNIISKSRGSFKLPDISKNFGDRIFDKQSSATLQKSILVYSMPKAQRFMSGPKYAGQPSYYVDTCFRPNGTKGVGFGYGNKRQFPEWLQKNMKEIPAPGAYFEDPKKTNVIRPRGPTFGISYKYYQKVTIPKDSPQKNVTVRSNNRLKPIVRNA